MRPQRLGSRAGEGERGLRFLRPPLSLDPPPAVPRLVRFVRALRLVVFRAWPSQRSLPLRATLHERNGIEPTPLWGCK